MKNKVIKIVELAQDKKAVNITALDLRKVCNFCDFFIILTGTSQTHIKSIADGINEGDYSNVIVHIFDEEARDFYDLEHLWSDAPSLDLLKGKKN